RARRNTATRPSRKSTRLPARTRHRRTTGIDPTTPNRHCGRSVGPIRIPHRHRHLRRNSPHRPPHIPLHTVVDDRHAQIMVALPQPAGRQTRRARDTRSSNQTETHKSRHIPHHIRSMGGNMKDVKLWIEERKAIHAKATPGEWWWEGESNEDWPQSENSLMAGEEAVV